jgi:hypothetical protein
VLRLVVLVLALFGASAPARAQELGHKVLGTLGIDAGRWAPPGIYVVDQLGYFSADEVRDRNGTRVPIAGLEIDAVANGLGVAGVFRLTETLRAGATAAFPLAHVSLSSTDPRAHLDAFGLSDAYVEPVRVGLHLPHADVILGYGLYIPTGRFEPSGGGVGSGQWTQQFSAGAGVFTEASGGWRTSWLVSFNTHSKKRDLDLTRGDMLQIQGGAGARVFGFADVGLAAYALWQTSDDQGSDLPAVVRGARDRVYGLGPEVGALIPLLRAHVTARYMWDFGVRSRPDGRTFVLSVAVLAWRPASL